MFPARRTCRWLFAVCAIAILALSLLPPGAPLPKTGWDKADHVFAFAALAWLGIGAFPGRLRLLVPALLAFGGLIEFLQSLTPYRQADGADILADAIGIAIGIAIGLWIAARRRLRPTRP
jgi:VanZ family protein